MSHAVVTREPLRAENPAISRDWERVRFATYIAVYGATVGGCAILLNILAQITFPDVPEHMSLGLSLFFGSVGAAAGFLVTLPAAYWAYGGSPTFAFTYRGRRGPRGVLPWLAVGIGFILAYPLALGITVPLVARLLSFWEGMINVPELLTSTLDLVVRIPAYAFSGGLQYFFTAIPAGVVFVIGARIIGLVSSSGRGPISRYGTSATALALSVGLVVVVAYAPEATLARFGALR